MKKKILIIMMGLLLVGASLYAAGNLQVNGNIGVGTAPSLDARHKIVADDQEGLVVETTTNNMSTMGAANLSIMAGGSVDWGNYYGVSNRSSHAGQNANLTRLLAGDNVLTFASLYSGTTNVEDAVAMRARVGNSNTFSRDYVFPNGIHGIKVLYSFDETTGGGTIATEKIMGLKITSPSGTHVSATNVAGIWVNPQTIGVNNYGIVLDGNNNGSDIVFGPNQEARVYSEVLGAETRLYASDSSGNNTILSPHDPETGEWIYFSKNTRTGRVVRVNMEKLVRAVEKLTGEKFMIETIEEQ